MWERERAVRAQDGTEPQVVGGRAYSQDTRWSPGVWESQRAVRVQDSSEPRGVGERAHSQGTGRSPGVWGRECTVGVQKGAVGQGTVTSCRGGFSGSVVSGPPHGGQLVSVRPSSVLAAEGPQEPLSRYTRASGPTQCREDARNWLLVGWPDRRRTKPMSPPLGGGL